MPPRKKSALSLTQIPSVRELCQKLGFQSSSNREGSGFTNTIHGFRKHYKTREGQSGADLMDWKSPIVQQHLTDMAVSYLEAGNGDIFWPNSSTETGLQYPNDKILLAELLKQLFWRQNKYAYNNSTYGEKRNSEPRDRLSRDITTPAQDEPSARQNSTLPPTFMNRPGTEYASLYDGPYSPRQTDDAQTTASYTVTEGGSIMDSSARTTVDDVRSHSRVTVAIEPPLRETPYDVPSKPIEKPTQSKPVSPRGPIQERSRPAAEGSANDARQHKRPRVTSSKQLKRRRHNIPELIPRSSGRTQRVRYEPPSIIEITDEEDLLRDNRNSRIRSSALPLSGLGGSPKNRSTRERPAADALTSAEVNSSKADKLVSPIAPTTSQSPRVPEQPPKAPEPPKVPELQALPDRAIPSSTANPIQAPKSKPNIRGYFWIVTSPEPNYSDNGWVNGTIQGKSLSFVVQEVSKITGKSNIEKLELKIKTPHAQSTRVVDKDDEAVWEMTKSMFTARIRESWAKNQDQPLEYHIWIEPIYATEVDSGHVPLNDQNLDFEFSL